MIVSELTTYVFNTGECVNGDDITQSDAEVVSDDAIDARNAVLNLFVGEHDQCGILPLLSLDDNDITTEELEEIHSVGRKCDDGIVIIDGIVNDQGYRKESVSISKTESRSAGRKIGSFDNQSYPGDIR